MPSTHTYRATVRWTGNEGEGTRTYRGYSRSHVIESAGKPPVPGTSSVGARIDPARYNPDELLVASLSSCHMLWYLHLCAESHVVVESYLDEAEGVLEMAADGSGHFTSATLRPRVVLREGSPARALELHAKAHEMCFIARSVNFPVRCEPEIVPASPA